MGNVLGVFFSYLTDKRRPDTLMSFHHTY